MIQFPPNKTTPASQYLAYWTHVLLFATGPTMGLKESKLTFSEWKDLVGADKETGPLTKWRILCLSCKFVEKAVKKYMPGKAYYFQNLDGNLMGISGATIRAEAMLGKLSMLGIQKNCSIYTGLVGGVPEKVVLTPPTAPTEEPQPVLAMEITKDKALLAKWVTALKAIQDGSPELAAALACAIKHS